MENSAKGYTLGIARILLHEGYSLKDVKFPRHFKILDVFETKDREHICLVKVSMPQQFAHMLGWIDIEVIWERPLVFTQETITFSCTGPEPGLERIVQFLKTPGHDNVSCVRGCRLPWLPDPPPAFIKKSGWS